MEDLNKTQIILLSLLVSFVTSIATGIITTSLLSEVPPVVTQTINRVVQQTIEKVGPTGDKIKEVTVVVKEEDLVIDAIDKNAKSVVRIKETLEGGTVESFFDIGLVISSDGLIFTDKKTFLVGSKYSATFSDGKVLPITPVTSDNNVNLIFFRADKGDNDSYVFDPADFMPGPVKLGQTVIAIGGEQRNSVSIGRVSDLVTGTANAPEATTTQAISLIKTDMVAKDNIVGAPLVNLSGEVVGVRVSSVDLITNDGFVPAQVIKQAIAKLPKR